MNRRQQIKNLVSGKIRDINYALDYGDGKNILANLRKGVGKEPGNIPEIFGTILEAMPEDFYSKNGIPTKEEWACYTALTLFSWHQQGFDLKKQPMHIDDGNGFGIALRRLAESYDDVNAKNRVLKKLHVIISSTEITGFIYQLRNAITLLRGEGITLDYGLLAADIYDWQYPDMKNSIGLKWGQDFFRNSFKEENKNEY